MLRRTIASLVVCAVLLAGSFAVAQLVTDTIPNPNTDSLVGFNALWNATTWSRWKSASLANFPPATTTLSSNENGRAVIEKGPRWSRVSTPAVSVQASATIAAEAGVRHVADTVCFSAGSTTAVLLTKLNVNLRDGASGAGTILQSWTVVMSASTGQSVPPVCFPDLQLTGTTNTAMTLEFSALLTNLFEDVTLTGFNVF